MFDQLNTLIGGVLSWDVLVLGAALIAVLAYAYTLGKDYGVTMIVALYIAALPFFAVPSVVEMIPTLGMAPYIAQIIFLGVLFLLIFFVISRNGFFESPMVPSLWEIGVFAILFTGLLAAIIYTFLPEDVAGSLSTLTQALFNDPIVLSVWLLLPVGFWVLIRGE